MLPQSDLGLEIPDKLRIGAVRHLGLGFFLPKSLGGPRDCVAQRCGHEAP